MRAGPKAPLTNDEDLMGGAMRLQPTGRFDNSARAYDHIEVTPLAAAMGAKVSGVDLSHLGDEAFAEIADALYRHGMIYFRDQSISHADQESFTMRFGAFGTDAYTKGLPEHPNVQPVVKEAETRLKMIFGEGWHTDSPFLARPPAISMLRGVDIPPYGGDTIWASTRLAYEHLSDAMKSMLAPLKVHMSAARVIATIDAINREGEASNRDPGSLDAGGADSKHTRLGNMDIDTHRQVMIEGHYHPLVRTHPVTGNKALYVDETYSHGIEGMSSEESKPLLDFLRAHVTQESFTCRLRWKNNTFAAWDNRICVHRAFNDYDGFRREMYRTTVMGETPA